MKAEDELAFFQERGHLGMARVLIAQGECAHALSLLNRLQQAAEAAGQTGCSIEILALQALALDAQGNAPAALAALEHALVLAEPEGYIRTFVDEGAPMEALLRDAHARRITPHYVAKLLGAFLSSEGHRLGTASAASSYSILSPQPSALVEPLSERELEILRLIAAGHSNQKIADALVIAVSTVKKHITNIYGKLEVQSRTQALARARELNQF